MFNVASAHYQTAEPKHSQESLTENTVTNINKKTFLTTVITKLSYRIDFGKLLQMSHVPPSFRPCPRTSTNVSTQ